MDNRTSLYFPSAIVQAKSGGRVYLWSSSIGELSINEAMTILDYIKMQYKVYSEWIDEFCGGNKKKTVHHKCFVNCFGDIM